MLFRSEAAIGVISSVGRHELWYWWHIDLVVAALGIDVFFVIDSISSWDIDKTCTLAQNA